MLFRSEEKLRTYVEENNLGQHVTFTGYVENVEEYLKASDCFVLPSRSEAFGLALCEAMACGLPCIGTTVGGIPDFVTDGENGLLIAPGDSDALKDAIWQLYSEEERTHDLGKHARATVKEGFSMQSVAEAHIETFEDILGMP